jgi:hypothetical protein
MTFNHQRRLDRALHHLKDLEAEVRAWEEECSYRTGTEPDADSRKKRFWVEIVDAPPTDGLGLIVGDCLHSLRAALDNLAFDLATAHFGRRLSSKLAEKSMFPIFATKDMRKFQDALGGVAPSAQAKIEWLQPYHRGQWFRNDPLWQLNKLSNIDKHRLPHPAIFATAAVSYVASVDAATDEIEPIFGAIKDRAPIARYPALDSSGAEMEVEFTPALSIGFGHTAPKQIYGVSVPQRLREIHHYITRQVLPPLVPYLT